MKQYADLLIGGAGAACALGAITVLIGWPPALLVTGVALVAIAVWMPPWD